MTVNDFERKQTNGSRISVTHKLDGDNLSKNKRTNIKKTQKTCKSLKLAKQSEVNISERAFK